ncbi:hypothetical protein MYAM1_001420 [Malassezia yamatoensis]|uniref:Protein LCHN n=1 Tax=Malassezia yamatoensis TaxID=253288 RepID=A0AAJ5YQE5_9BASI|nr:hypothetical protein MYAM1_001420 [Malassezia yamatoensis]
MPKNVRGIYVAEFVPREGNAIIHSYPENLSVEGFEWKVLPSGGHEIHSDVIHFESGECHDGILFNVAAFRVRRFSAEEIQQDSRGHRGARLIAVGVTLVCPSTRPGCELTNCLPHIEHLERMAEDVLDGIPLHSLNSYVDRFRHHGDVSYREHPSVRCCLRCLSYDPVTYLCAMSRFLGPLMVPLIKILKLPKKRVLLYSPAPIERAAIIGFNLTEIIHAAYVHAGGAPGDVRVKGCVTLFDLPRLKQEAESDAYDYAWIAWTSDKIYKENHDVYDLFLDVSAFPYPGAPRHLSNPVPMGHRISLVEDSIKCDDLRWTTSDLTLYMELAEQDKQYEQILHQKQRPEFDEWRTTSDDAPPSGMRVSALDHWNYLQQDGRLMPLGYSIFLVASLRVWLAEWWLIRSQLHVAVPLSLVFPLGVRGDGGISTGIVDLSDSNVSSDQDEGYQTDDSTGSKPDTSTQQHQAGTSDIRSLAESLKDSAHSMKLREQDPDSISVYSQDDPLIAACGLGVPAVDRFKRHSCFSNSDLDPRRFSHNEHAERSFVPAHPRFDPSKARQLPMETMSSVYLFTLWSSYIRATHIQASAFLIGRINQLSAERPNEATPLFAQQDITMSANDFNALSLDLSQALDQETLQNILSSLGPYRLKCRRPWSLW